ncbi:MAG: hypothetical protein A3J83_01340 [Elusimicrobia bacterium RIFOXYA2_FULL_40_6]|nr:MAG: hypothetical protein A3J83_01340 [Elusimicrobia bacterium RIFOXYA2_FULL_40_6]
MTIEKKITVKKGSLTVDYSITYDGDAELDLIFSPEFCLAFSYKTDADEQVIESAHHWKRTDDGFGFAFELKGSLPVAYWAFPLETVSLSENGFERTYQGTVVLPRIPLRLVPHQ